MSDSSQRRYEWVRLIGWFKIVQGGLLFVLAAGILRFLNRTAETEVARELVRLHVDLDSPWVQRLLDRLGHVNRHQMMTLSTGGFAYSLLLLVEGTGLCLQRRWGDYFTLLVTGSFLPFELYECVRRFSLIPLGVLLLNAAILAYLTARVKREHRSPSGTGGEASTGDGPFRPLESVGSREQGAN